MRFFRGLLIFSFVLLTACAGSQTVNNRSDSVDISSPLGTVNSAQTIVIGTARKMLGTPYRYGGTNPNGFDCSGLVSYSYRSAGIRVPRTSNEQFRQAERVALPNLQPGDLLFFRLSPPKVSHVAIYDHAGRFIHAPSSGKQVSYASLDNPYWQKHLVGAGRF